MFCRASADRMMLSLGSLVGYRAMEIWHDYQDFSVWRSLTAGSITLRRSLYSVLSTLLVACLLTFCPASAEEAESGSSRWEKLEASAEKAFVDEEYEKSRELWMQALKVAESDPKQELNVATTLNQLNHLFVHTKEYEKASAFLKRALAIRKKLLGENHLLTAETIGNLALISHKLGHDHEAEDLYLEALKIKDKLLGEDSLESATTMHNLAELYSLHRDYSRARDMYEKVLSIDRKKRGDHHVEIVRDLTSLGVNAYRCKRYKEAIDYFNQAEDEASHQVRSYKVELVPIYHYLGLSYGNLKQHEKAREFHKLAHSLGTEVHGKHHPANTVALLNLAQVCDEMGEDKEAESIYLKALNHERERSKPSPYLLTEVNLELAQYYHRHELDEEAERFYREALKTYAHLPGYEKRKLYELPVAFSDLLTRVGKKEEAEEISKRYLHLHSPHKLGHYRVD